MAAAWDPELMYLEASVIAEEARAKYNVSVKYGDRDIYKGLTIMVTKCKYFFVIRVGEEDMKLMEKILFLHQGLRFPFYKGAAGRWKIFENGCMCKTFCSAFRTGGSETFI